MNFKKVVTVYQKELLEMLRDKRTLFTTILLPVILYPLIFIGFSSLMSRQTVKLEEKGATIAVADSVLSPASALISKELKGIEFFTLLPYNKDSEGMYKDKRVQAIVTIRDSLTLDGIRTYKVSIKFDKSSEQGQMLIAKVNKAMQQAEKQLVETELSSLGLNPQIINIVDIHEKDTSSAQKKVGMILGMILPYLLIILLISGAAVVAADLVAGEKERHTLETLLVSAAHRTEIVLGKYLTIITIAMINVLVNLISLFFSAKYMAAQGGMETSGVKLPLDGFLILFLALIPLATLFAAVLLSISTFSRNMKEARSYEQPILTVSMLLAMISFFPAFELNNLMALIPIINISLLFKAVMIGEYQLRHLWITIGSTLVLDVIAIWTTIKLFNSEKVLFRTDDDSSLKNVRKDKRTFFNSYYGLIYFVIALLLLFYLGGAWQKADLGKGLVQTQLLLILLPVLLVLRVLKLNPKETLRLKAPKLQEIALIPFIAIPAAIIVSMLSQLINSIFPFPSEYLEQLGKLFQMDIPLWQQIIIIAVLPGICEEILFRGFMVRFYEAHGTKVALVVSAVLFAAFHLDPFRFLPVLVLGLLLSWLTLRSGSIYNSMFSHALNNGFALFITIFAGSAWLKPLLQDADNLKTWLLLPAVLVLGLALYLFNKVTATPESLQIQGPGQELNQPR
ncbi:MAG TPA: ABC transporter permease subunit/CPBP intramembrane protease [Candidatus Cloacimonadota bacterium]|nr:ABC transporter permease subunit/CPBP intramembrane protease [Candidatus Cloacimonadota bacterium]